ncbi:hypothetical protein BN1723_004984 [Verticillium longisporum]|uniref:Uncharacterized protein n=1 Tax=Verticillium longisporum TaxID=100787 RepID=A0A0G4N2T2_VERLO|nr:hypothetical protein BN1708_000577 [Verticillium longisporum]CRK40896.1 hypothetical protein BN1723_004984 [Verticillium longisporum]
MIPRSACLRSLWKGKRRHVFEAVHPPWHESRDGDHHRSGGQVPGPLPNVGMGGGRATIFSRSGRSPPLTPSTPRPDPASFPDGNGRPPRLDKIACFPRHERQKDTIASINLGPAERKNKRAGDLVRNRFMCWTTYGTLTAQLIHPYRGPTVPFHVCSFSYPVEWEARPGYAKAMGREADPDRETYSPMEDSTRESTKKKGNPESASEKEQESVKRKRERETDGAVEAHLHSFPNVPISPMDTPRRTAPGIEQCSTSGR